MNRLEKKCLILSTAFHLLLVAILVIGPVFLSRKAQSQNLPMIDFTPIVTTDAKVSGGGNPNARPPPSPPVAKPQPPAPTPPPEPEHRAKQEVVKEEKAEVAKPIADSFEPSRDRKPRKPEISMKLVSRRSTTHTESKTAAEDSARAQAAARQRLARVVSQAAQALADEASSSTTIELKGPGGGGVPYANFMDGLKRVYYLAWQGMVPDNATDRTAVAGATVTIARDGTVLSFELTEPSGNRQVDRAARLTLERVREVPPLPPDATEAQRTVTVYFEAKPKLGTG